jgi:hypothetical protein
MIKIVLNVTITDFIIFIITISAYIIMVIGIKKNNGKGQNFFTWLLWTVLDILLLITAILEKSSSAILILSCVIGSFITTLFLISYKKMNWTWHETFTLITTVTFVILWIYSQSNLLGLILMVIAQLIAGWPLMRESWINPESKYNLASYLVFMFGYILTIYSSPNLEIQNILFPVAFLIYTLGDTYPLLKKWIKDRK